jgi:hypothetical protein
MGIKITEPTPKTTKYKAAESATADIRRTVKSCRPQSIAASSPNINECIFVPSMSQVLVVKFRAPFSIPHADDLVQTMRSRQLGIYN